MTRARDSVEARVYGLESGGDDYIVKSATPVYVRDIGIEVPSGHLVTGHIIATDPRGQSLLPKSSSAAVDAASFA